MIQLFVTDELITVHVALELEDGDVSTNEANIKLFNVLIIPEPTYNYIYYNYNNIIIIIYRMIA